MYLAAFKPESMQLNKIVFLALVSFSFIACNRDDGLGGISIAPRDLSEVVAEDEVAIKEYLQTHFYNYEEFNAPPADFDFRIKIDTIAGENADKIPLIEQVGSKTVSVRATEFNLNSDEVVDHTLYYLVAREGDNGNGLHPTIADSTFVRYKGSLLDGTVFDASTSTAIWFDLAQIQAPSQGARGFTEGMPFLQTGGAPVVNDDGTFTVEGYGVGLIIMPSGLGFYNVAQGQIPAYSPLMFEVDLFSLNRTDHDGDGIPSIDEDLDGNGFLYDDNTDQEAEDATGTFARRVNFLDDDDDQDGTLTRDEIIIDEEGNITFPDTDGDGIPNYLDPDDSDPVNE